MPVFKTQMRALIQQRKLSKIEMTNYTNSTGNYAGDSGFLAQIKAAEVDAAKAQAATAANAAATAAAAAAGQHYHRCGE